MLYNSSDKGENDNDNDGKSIGDNKVYNRKIELVLVLLLDLYSLLDSILVSANGPSSCPA